MRDTAPLPEMTGAELASIRRRSGFRRDRFCGALGITSNVLAALEKDAREIPRDVAERARRIDGQGATTRRVGVATFGEMFAVVRFSLFDELDVWRVDILPIVHDNRTSAVLAARDYARLHGCEFAAIGFPVTMPRAGIDRCDGDDPAPAMATAHETGRRTASKRRAEDA